MLKRFRRSWQQMQYLGYEVKKMNGRGYWRWLSCWFAASFWAIASYRIERSLFLLLGPAWSLLRILLSPLIFLLRPWINTCEIHYQADIGRGLKVLHPTLGVVISKYAIVGQNLILTGGNCIGGRRSLKNGDLMVGDNVSLGANAVILGPVQVGNNVQVGAGAVVVKNATDGEILIGVPARPYAPTASS